MYTPEEIAAARNAQVQAIFDRFEPVETPAQELEKSVETEEATTQEKSSDVYWTKGDLDKYKEDLFKGIDDGSLTTEDLEKAQDSLFELVKTTRTIEGEEVEVFVKG